jgi:Protein of unknown function (DUF1549)
VADPKVPLVTRKSWPVTDVDRFILAKLEEKKLAPVPDARPVVLVRRLTYDLTGLPPTPAEIDAYIKDRSPAAYPRLVDRLLASPRFGERWGRHWLDVRDMENPPARRETFLIPTPGDTATMSSTL